MNIVVLDAYTLNPGDLSWEALKGLANCNIYDRSTPEEIKERAAKAEIILTNKAVLKKEVLQECKNIRYIGILATGTNVVDLETATQLKIPVCNVPDYGAASVAQMVFAHILHHTQAVAVHSDSVHNGEWTKNIDWCYWKSPLIELQNKVMGIIGLGSIGRATARIARGFGMKVIAHRGSDPENLVSMVSIEELFKKSDFISLHCPLTEETKELINENSLNLMKKNTYIINTGRGPLISEQALANALNQGIIAGAGLDVASVEPIKEDNPLLKAKNCSITPHIGWATRAARQRLLDIVIDNISAFQKGEIKNQVNPF